jgi:HD-GYP domain-containing protein (c-di-GMP phosphodiesterase class II)
MMSHSEIGHSIMLAAELPVEAEWVLYHHERYDGAGYPEGKRAAEIPLPARIIAVADAYEAMTSDRPDRPSVGPAEAIAELRRHSGTQFDGRCVAALVDVIAESGATEIELTDAPEPRLPALRVLPGGAAARVA